MADLTEERARLAAVLLRLTGDEIDAPVTLPDPTGTAPGPARPSAGGPSDSGAGIRSRRPAGSVAGSRVPDRPDRSRSAAAPAGFVGGGSDRRVGRAARAPTPRPRTSRSCSRQADADGIAWERHPPSGPRPRPAPPPRPAPHRSPRPWAGWSASAPARAATGSAPASAGWARSPCGVPSWSPRAAWCPVAPRRQLG